MKFFLMVLFAVVGMNAQAAVVTAAAQDQLKAVFDQARGQAATSVNGVMDCQIQNSFLSPDLKGWLSTRRALLAQDLMSSPHTWNMGNFQACASTLNQPYSEIQFSYGPCAAAVNSSLDATRILLEQSIYHQGLSDADQIHTVAAFLNSPAPSCNPPGTVWDPGICAQQPMQREDLISYLQPGQSEIFVGRHQFYFRYHQCNVVTGCAPWMEVTPDYYMISGAWKKPADIDGRLRIFTTNNGTEGSIGAQHPDLDVRTVALKSISFTISGKGGSIYRHCTWEKLAGETGRDGDGNYFGTEVVYYGTH